MNTKAIKIPTVKPAKQAPKVASMPTLASPEVTPMVDRLSTLKAQSEALDRETSELRGKLDPMVNDYRNTLEGEGTFTKSVQVKGSAANGKYSFKDAYSPIDASAATDLSSLLGVAYGALFESVTVKAIIPSKLDDLMVLLGARASEFMTVQEVIKPCDSFREARYGARSTLSDSQNEALDEVVKQIQAKPSLSFK